MLFLVTGSLGLLLMPGPGGLRLRTPRYLLNRSHTTASIRSRLWTRAVRSMATSSGRGEMVVDDQSGSFDSRGANLAANLKLFVRTAI